MKKTEIFPFYRKTVERLNNCFEIMQEYYAEDSVDELIALRGYTEDIYSDTFNELHIGICHIEDTSVLPQDFFAVGLVNEKGKFLLNDRFVIPVHGVSGDLVGFIGYYPDDVKYIVCPTPFFSKDCLLFNFKQAYELSWTMYNGYVILVEGLFDCLSLRALGLPALATMGSTVSKAKGIQLNLFNKVLAIPDDDKTGHKALDPYSKQHWNIPSTGTFLRFEGGMFQLAPNFSVHCKDMDNFISWYDTDDVVDLLLQFQNSEERMEVLSLC